MNRGTRRRPSWRSLGGLVLRLAVIGSILLSAASITTQNPVSAQSRPTQSACAYNGGPVYYPRTTGFDGAVSLSPLNVLPSSITLTGTYFIDATIASFPLLAYEFGFIPTGTTTVEIDTTVTVFASNTVEGSQSLNLSAVAATVVTDPDGVRFTWDESATPLSNELVLPASTWTPTGVGDVKFSEGPALTTIILGTLTATIDCLPGVPSNCASGGTNCVSFTPLPAVPFANLPADGLRLQHLAPIVSLSTVTLGNGAAVAFGTLPPLLIDNDGSNTVGWTLSAYVTDFLGPGALDCSVPGADCIPGDNLGWMPVVPIEYRSPGPGTAGVTAGPASALSAADWLAMLETAGPAGLNGLGGLGDINVLCVAAPGSPGSTVGCGAELFLGVPASAAAGDYSAVLVLTIT